MTSTTTTASRIVVYTITTQINDTSIVPNMEDTRLLKYTTPTDAYNSVATELNKLTISTYRCSVPEPRSSYIQLTVVSDDGTTHNTYVYRIYGTYDQLCTIYKMLKRQYLHVVVLN